MSMLCPSLRSCGNRSTTVTLAPALANQYAVMGPATEAPETRTLSCGIVLEVLTKEREEKVEEQNYYVTDKSDKLIRLFGRDSSQWPT